MATGVQVEAVVSAEAEEKKARLAVQRKASEGALAASVSLSPFTCSTVGTTECDGLNSYLMHIQVAAEAANAKDPLEQFCVGNPVSSLLL